MLLASLIDRVKKNLPDLKPIKIKRKEWFNIYWTIDLKYNQIYQYHNNLIVDCLSLNIDDLLASDWMLIGEIDLNDKTSNIEFPIDIIY
jgi:hypothetical protein